MSAKFHAGELAVQARVGVQNMASKVGNGIHPQIPPIAQNFLRQQQMAVAATIAANGQVWASLLTGAPGFIRALDEQAVLIEAQSTAGDLLVENLRANSAFGLIVIDLATRRRMRLNGTAEMREAGRIYMHTQQVYSNCPKYIQVRELASDSIKSGAGGVTRQSEELTQAQQQWLGQADTFFIATAHPEGGADASHRGGYPGFVRVLNEKEIIFPDYSGNRMFQTLGNLAVNPAAGLLFVDFERGNTLQLSGKAQVLWESEYTSDFAGAERIIKFEIEQIIEIANATTLHGELAEYSPFNPI